MRPPALAPVLISFLLAGCGSDGAEPTTSGRAPAEVTASAPVAATQGRTGDATVASSRDGVRTLAKGGRIDARANRRRQPDRQGVGTGAACENLELVPTAANLSEVTAATICLLNGERADAGLGPLALNEKLAEAARRHALDMVERQYFEHDSPDGRGIADRLRSIGYIDDARGWVVGENLAWGSGALSTPRSIMQAWMDSPGHRANVLKPDYREVGMGIVLGTPRSAAVGGTYAHAFGALSGPSAGSSTTSGQSSARSTASERRARRARALRRCRARGKSRKARVAARRCRARLTARRR